MDLSDLTVKLYSDVAIDSQFQPFHHSVFYVVHIGEQDYNIILMDGVNTSCQSGGCNNSLPSGLFTLFHQDITCSYVGS